MAADPIARIVTATKNMEKWHTERDDAVRAAAAAGVTPTEISRASGLSRAHVYRLIKE